ncbi:S-adenosylmethionine transporter [Malassezia nana]|uniref:S-adenosylmethionine transporter n=1 Tax=Malassezia nana TaxID=180528 RepID=A0AAF0EHZ2_9BASI|nr:S-adenosylmethionine transporter [Malassezia nana]
MGQNTIKKRLGDVHLTPASIQVFNATLFDKMRGRSMECGLGLGSSELSQESVKSVSSLREYASKRVEHEKLMFDTIQNATDVSKLLWEAQMAYMARCYVLATVLYRRLSELDVAYACACLAKMFGFGIMQNNVVLFERDTLRGIAWAIRGLQLIIADIRDVHNLAQVQTLSQILALLCILVCAPESMQTLRTDDQHADVSLSLLLLFPRSCELLHPRRRVQNTIPSELTRESIWMALRDVLSRTAALQETKDVVEPSDSAHAELLMKRVRIDTLYLEAFLVMRQAFLHKDASLIQETYTCWTQYLTEGKDMSDGMDLSGFRRVASEGQQWAVPDDERKTSATLSQAEFSALSRRISAIFPFTDPKQSTRTSQPIFSDSTNAAAAQKTKHSSHPPVSDKSKAQAKPQFLSSITPSTVSFTPSKDQATSHRTRKYTGITSHRLRDVQAIPQRRFISAEATPNTFLKPEEPHYLTRMNETLPSQRRRTPSIVSVTPSLMFPSTSEPSALSSDAATEVMDQAVQTKSAYIHIDNDGGQALRARLLRQSSRASLRGGL